MTLEISTHFLNKQETLFVDKILEGLILTGLISKRGYERYSNDYLEAGYIFSVGLKPKLHTILKDENNRWEVSQLIHLVINNKTKKRLQFAPMLQIVNIQKIEIKKLNSSGDWKKDFVVSVDDKYLDAEGIALLSDNDGFEDVDDFFKWFNIDFTGKIIHWTPLWY